MTRDDAIAFVNSLLGDGVLPDFLIGQAVDGAVIPDDAGRMPGDPQWTPTFDGWWAAADAALLADTMQGDRLTSVTSEGTTMQIAPTDWHARANTWRARSSIGTSRIGTITVPRNPPYRPTSDGMHVGMWRSGL